MTKNIICFVKQALTLHALLQFIYMDQAVWHTKYADIFSLQSL